jgi:hypothetical protein
MLKAPVQAAVTQAPAPWLVTGLGTLAALVVAFGHLGPNTTALVYSLAAVGGTMVSAALTRPVAVAVLAGSAVTVLGDLTLFGVPALSPDQKGAVVAALTFALGAFLHLAHVPVETAAAPPRQPPASP